VTPTLIPSVGVVVVAYRSATTIGDCLSSCLDDDAVAAVVVIDNADEPACRQIVDAVAGTDPRVRYATLGNVGFARGCNEGVARLPAVDVVAFVNPDVCLHRPLGELATYLESTGATIVSARLLTAGDPAHLNARPHTSWPRELVGAVVGRDRAYRLPSATRSAPEGQPLRVSQPDGALMLLRRHDFDALGGFDDRFELYYDDVDLAARAERLAGSVLVNRTWGSHVGGVSSAAASQMAYCAGTVSRVRYLAKRYGRPVGSAAAGAVAVVEFGVRSATRRREGQSARNAALGMQVRELRAPLSVAVLR